MQRTRGVPTQPLLIAVVLTASGTGLAYWLMGLPPLLGAEDAAIGFRYARNLASGEGIVFNPGGEHVEGFTSLLWLLLSAAAYGAVGEASLEVVLFVGSLAMTALVLALVVSMVFEHVARGPGRWVAVLWLAGQAGFYFWSALSLMDVALWSAGLTAYVVVLALRLEGRPTPHGLLVPVVVALILTRPEAMLVVPGALVAAALGYGLGGQMRRIAYTVLGTAAATLAGLTAFRISYFGHPLPNTYYAKVSPDLAYRLRGGVDYVAEYLMAHPVAFVALIAVAATLVARAIAIARGRWTAVSVGPEGPGTRLAILAAGFIVLGFASVVYGGGDHYQGHRFLQAYLPMAAMPIGLGVAALHAWVGKRLARARIVVTVVAVGLVAAPLSGEWTTFRDHGLRRQAIDVGLQGRFVGRTLDEAFSETGRPELGLWMVGGAGYAYTGPVKDLLGLNWVAMGMSPGDRRGPRDHAAFNTDVFWSEPPELMIPEPEAVLRGVRCVRGVLAGAMHGVLVSPRFRAEFEPVRIARGEGEPMIAYARADWLRGAPGFVQPLGWAYCDGA